MLCVLSCCALSSRPCRCGVDDPASMVGTRLYRDVGARTAPWCRAQYTGDDAGRCQSGSPGSDALIVLISVARHKSTRGSGRTAHVRPQAECRSLRAWGAPRPAAYCCGYRARTRKPRAAASPFLLCFSARRSAARGDYAFPWLLSSLCWTHVRRIKNKNSLTHTHTHTGTAHTYTHILQPQVV